jgi:hypothetical protein
MIDALRAAREADSFTIMVMRDGRARPLRYSVR